MLARGHCRPGNAGAPEGIEPQQPRRCGKAAQQAVQPQARENGGRDMQGRAGVARRVDVFQELHVGVLEPVDVGRGSGRRPEVKHRQAAKAGERDCQAVVQQFAPFGEKQRRQRHIHPQRQINRQGHRCEDDEFVGPGTRHDGDGKCRVLEQVKVRREKQADEGRGAHALEDEMP
jgi:hypothetical protein